MQRLRRVVVIAGLVGLGAVISMALPSQRIASGPATPRPTHAVVANTELTAPRKLPRGVEVGFLAADGLEIAGQFFQAENPAAPVVIFLHRWGGSREEFRPMVQPTFAQTSDTHLLLLDLRGHGQSTQRRGDTKQVKFGDMTVADRRLMADDVLAVMVGLEARLKTKVPGYILVGSDLGATIGAYVMQRQPRVTGLAMVSPGPMLNGLDLYAGLSGLRGRRAFLIAATKDNVSAEPLKVFESMMGPNAKSVPIDGDGHGAGVLGDKSPEVWSMLANWVARTRENIVPPRDDAPAVQAPIENAEPLVLPSAGSPLASSPVAEASSPSRPPLREPSPNAMRQPDDRRAPPRATPPGGH